MRDQWWRSILGVAEHSFVSTSMFIVVTAAAIVGSRLVEIAAQQIESKFVIYALSLLKYAIVVVEMCFALAVLVTSTMKKLRSLMR